MDDDFAADYWTITDLLDDHVTLREHKWVREEQGRKTLVTFAPEESRNHPGEVITAETIATIYNDRLFDVHTVLHEYDGPEGWKSHILEKGAFYERGGYVKFSHRNETLDDAPRPL